MPAGERQVRILAFIPNLSGGGAERAVLRMSEAIDHARFDFRILAHEKWGSLVDQVAPGTPLQFVRAGPYRRSSLPLLFFRTLKDAATADILLGANEGRATFFALISGLVLGKPVVSWIHNNWSEFGKHVSWKQRMALKLTTVLSRKLVACSQGVADDLVDNHHVPRNKVTCIYHGLPSEEIKSLAGQPIESGHEIIFSKPVVITAGRLDPQKGQKLLIEAHSLLVHQGFDHNLVLLGEGDQLASLQDFTCKLGVSESVYFLGFRQNPFSYIARSTVFALSSRYEGFGLVLAEAQICGIPVVSTNCPSGPSEILGEGKYGLLAETGSATSLAKNIGRLLGSSDEWQRFASAAEKRGLDFSQDIAMAEWETLLAGFPSA
jgi:glycosyltransferase involved in cell wall biosynthesis